MRALFHIGLATLLVIAPALCCCNIRVLTGRVSASTGPAPACPSCPESAPAAKSACCETPVKPVRKSCCSEPEPESPAPTAQKSPAPQPPAAPHCKCLGERPAGLQPQTAPEVAAPEPTGELLPAAFLVPAAVPPEHLGLIGGLDPPERAGVDARSEALFSRHVLRC